jgi:hypothetical protein
MDGVLQIPSRSINYFIKYFQYFKVKKKRIVIELICSSQIWKLLQNGIHALKLMKNQRQSTHYEENYPNQLFSKTNVH